MCALSLLDQFLPFNPTDVVALSPVERFLKAVGAAKTPPATTSKTSPTAGDVSVLGKTDTAAAAPETTISTPGDKPQEPPVHSYYNAPTHDYYNETGAQKPTEESVSQTPDDYETMYERQLDSLQRDTTDVTEDTVDPLVSEEAFPDQNNDEDEEIYYEEVTLKADDESLNNESESVGAAATSRRRRRRRRRKRHGSGSSSAGGADERRH